MFAELLKLELTTLVLPHNHSRLRAHLPMISDSLFRWSEDRSNQGIWATLGFGPISRLPAEFRFGARILALFVTIRLLDPEANEQRTRLLESLAKFRSGSEYQPFVANGMMDEAESLLKATDPGLSSLPNIVDSFIRKLFPSWADLVKPL
jgi:hypothetical protein